MLFRSLLLTMLRRKGIFVPQPGWLVFAIKTAIALAGMGTCLHFAMGTERYWLEAGLLLRLLMLSGLVALGAGVYFALLWLLGFRMRDFRRTDA